MGGALCVCVVDCGGVSCVCVARQSALHTARLALCCVVCVACAVCAACAHLFSSDRVALAGTVMLYRATTVSKAVWALMVGAAAEAGAFVSPRPVCHHINQAWERFAIRQPVFCQGAHM